MSGFPGSGGFPLTLSGTPGAGKTLVATSGTAGVWALGLTEQAATPAAGVALINGTQTFLTWTAPADGVTHFALVVASLDVTTLEVGGLCRLTFTTLGVASQFQVFAPSLAVGITVGPWSGISVDPGTTVNVVQQNALTSGASVFQGVLLAA